MTLLTFCQNKWPLLWSRYWESGYITADYNPWTSTLLYGYQWNHFYVHGDEVVDYAVTEWLNLTVETEFDAHFKIRCDCRTGNSVADTCKCNPVRFGLDTVVPDQYIPKCWYVRFISCLVGKRDSGSNIKGAFLQHCGFSVKKKTGFLMLPFLFFHLL